MIGNRPVIRQIGRNTSSKKYHVLTDVEGEIAEDAVEEEII